MRIITQCPAGVSLMGAEILKKHHGAITDLVPRIGYYFVEFDNETLERHKKKAAKALAKGIILDPPAVLKLHGVRCAATIRVNSYADRVQGKPDVTVTIARDSWEAFSDEQKLALIDHELEHLLPDLDDEKNPRSDDLGRPKFKMRPHDWDLSGFASVVRRHGRAAVEVKTTVNFITSADGQMLMEFGGIKALAQ
jgi:hypothetical protein